MSLHLGLALRFWGVRGLRRLTNLSFRCVLISDLPFGVIAFLPLALILFQWRDIPAFGVMTYLPLALNK